MALKRKVRLPLSALRSTATGPAPRPDRVLTLGFAEGAPYQRVAVEVDDPRLAARRLEDARARA